MTTTPAHQPDRKVMTFRTTEDVLAAIPVLLTFEPSESVVMLTFGGRESFHARVDLPPPGEPDGLDEVIRLLLEPAVAHGVARVLFVVYSEWPALGDQVLARLGADFRAEGIAVVKGLRADGARWFLPGAPGVPYDVGAHPFRVRSVWDGNVVSGSREELAGRLRPTAGVGEVTAARSRVGAYDATEVVATVWRALDRGRMDDDDLAGVLQGLRDLAVRDAAWASMTRADAPAHVALWTDAVQRAPDDLVAAPAAVLALAAWLAGHGALAWCAVDRCVEHEPDNTLADLVGDLLGNAVPPSTWESRPYPGRGEPG